jgi:hypothetical protein
MPPRNFGRGGADPEFLAYAWCLARKGEYTMMHKFVCGLCAFASMAWAFPVHAQATGPAQATAPALELAFMPQMATVTLLNEGGKYVIVDLKHIPQGGTCRMDKDAPIMRVGVDTSPETTRVRYAAAQISAGGCPFLTMFDMANTDYAAGRAAFLKMEGDASKKVEQVKQVLGEQWQEIFGKKD